ncbi:PIG-L deacetylase family protein [uncultured Sphingomonas sp.]|uniref:PIG-L deacetylase family protein n=1 Tax=uncultured Sphingomonas sp. TaxID=158754 RepID=UPI0035C97CF8
MKLVAVSPHLDDAAFSAGATLAQRAAEGWQVTIATCFTGTVARPQGFALACQLDKGLSPDVDYMALRRQEDLDACAALGATAIHLPFLEAPHRGYASAPELFAGRRADDQVVVELTASLSRLLSDVEPDVVMGPLCLGDHVDHHIVRDALTAVVGARSLLLWEDWPYADRAARTAEPPVMTVDLDSHGRASRLRACRCYRSQLDFQFGGAEALARRIGHIEQERFYGIDHRGRAPTRAA